MIDYVIIDNWYENPEEIRNIALEKLNSNKSFGESKVKENGYGSQDWLKSEETTLPTPDADNLFPARLYISLTLRSELMVENPTLLVYWFQKLKY